MENGIRTFIPWTTALWTIASHEIQPRKIIPRTFSAPYNFSWLIPVHEIPPGQLPPQTFAPRTITSK